MNKIFSEVATIYLKDGHEFITTKDWQSALIEFEKAYNLDNGLLEALFYIGFVRRELNQTEKAMEIFLKVLSINPNHVAALINMSYYHCRLNRYEDALAYMNKAIDIDSDYYTYMDRARIKEALGDLEGAAMDEEAAGEIGRELPF